MGYLRAKSDLSTLIFFKETVTSFWDRQSAYDDAARTGYRAVVFTAEEIDPGIAAHYAAAREIVAKTLPKAVRIARRLGVPITVTSIPAPAVGGAVFDVNLFEAILMPARGRGISRELILDAVNKTLGACEDQVETEFWRMLNPFSWAQSILRWVLRLPFATLEATGFDVSKIEEHLFGKLFKVLEIGGIVVFVYFVMRWLGFNPEQTVRVLSGIAKVK